MISENVISVFVSSKQGELDLERAIVRQQIEAAGLIPVLAEDWVPERRDSRHLYLEGVRTCPVYIGIFFRVYSLATVEEYQEAITNPYREILIYQRKAEERRRDERLRQFLAGIRERHVILYYDEPQDLLKIVAGHLQLAIKRMIERLLQLGGQAPKSLNWGEFLNLPTGGLEAKNAMPPLQEYLRALGFPNGEFNAEQSAKAVAMLASCLGRFK